MLCKRFLSAGLGIFPLRSGDGISQCASVFVATRTPLLREVPGVKLPAKRWLTVDVREKSPDDRSDKVMPPNEAELKTISFVSLRESVAQKCLSSDALK